MTISLDNPVRISKLDAVNIILQARGKNPTSQLGDGARTDAQDAENALAEASISVQQNEWSFNEDRERKLSRNSSSEIELPNNLLNFEPVSSSANLTVTQRGSRLYDTTKGTFKFDQDVTLAIKYALPFEDLPQPARWYITMLASFNFGNQSIPGDVSLRPTEVQISKAKAALETFDNKLRPHNLRNNPHFKRLRGNR